MQIKPFSDNVIFFDTEFSSLNPYKGEILSLALVKLNEEELYLELEHSGDVDEWPLKNVVPRLQQRKVSREQAVKDIVNFVGQEKPYVIAYVNQFDMTYLYKFLNLDTYNQLFHWIPIDFASILFSYKISPEVIIKQNKKFFDDLNIDLSRYNQHYALDDARLLRDIYCKIV